MPQPLRKWDATIAFGPNATFLRPALAPWVVAVSSSWTNVEIALAFLLGVTLGTDVRSGIGMYLALTGSGAQEAALTAAVATHLPKSLQDEFGLLLPKLRRRSAERNRVVHALWGAGDAYPDALINCPPGNMVMDATNILHLHLFNDEHETNLPIPDGPSQRFIEQCFIYKEPDVRDIVARLGVTKDEIDAFSKKAGDHQAQRRALTRALMRGPAKAEAATHPDKPQTNPEEQT